jgi:crotonobetaine/carnitine-CoA ligase
MRDTVSPFENFDVNSLLEQRAADRQDHPFIIWAPFEGPSRTWSYAKFADDVSRIAGGLSERGVQVGDRVLVQLENCPEAMLMLFACARVGAVHVPVAPSARPPEVAWFVEFTEAVGVVTQPSLAAGIANACPSHGWMAVTVTNAGAAASDPLPVGATGFESLYGETSPKREADPTLNALIMFTSGTTSRPKGVVWTHANVLWGARLGATQQGLRAEDVVQLFLPLNHVVALSWTFLPTLWAGATVVLQPRFSASRYWPAAIEYGVTVGSQVIFTAKVLAQQAVPSHRIRQWTDALNPPGQEAYFNVRILGAWGMTEMVGQGIVGDPFARQRAGSIGRPSLAYGIHVLNDDGSPTPNGIPGNLLVNGMPGLSIFKEYFRDPTATREAFDENGLFKTGDRVIVHEDGFIQFSERVKDVIKVGGEGVSPAEIERVVMEVTGVREVAVVANLHESYGEVPIAFIVLDEVHRTADHALVAASVIGHCSASLSKFKVPREVIVLDDLPRINFGKIAKVKLREWLRSRT